MQRLVAFVRSDVPESHTNTVFVNSMNNLEVYLANLAGFISFPFLGRKSLIGPSLCVPMEVSPIIAIAAEQVVALPFNHHLPLPME